MEQTIKGPRGGVQQVFTCDHCGFSIRRIGHRANGKSGPLRVYRYGEKHYCLDCVKLGYGQYKGGSGDYDAPWPDK